MRKAIAVALIFQVLMMANAFAADTCSRTAVINYQEVLVDTNSAQKGEGLRYYLEKDPKALELLNKYQKGTKTNWINAGLGTIGTLMILGGFLTTSSKSGKRSLLITGSSVIALNFLVAKTLEHKNESNLQQAIKEYNARNLPRIYFNPAERDPVTGNKNGPGFLLNYSKGF